MKKNYIISGTALVTILATITLLRDVFDFKLAVSDVAAWFQNPILYLYGGLMIFLFCIGILIGLNLSRQGQDSEIKVFDLSNNLESELFYKELYRSYQSAESEIYFTGTGFVGWSGSQQKLIDDILSVTEDTLERGVTFMRIQKSDNPAEEWADRFANIMQNHSENLKVYADFNNIELANTALIDPTGKYPIVQILFETE